ncbi:MAG: hypothetical protein WCL16_04500 [bacterium]
MRKLLFIFCLCGAAVCSGQGYFEAGPWYRGNMKLSVKGGSRAADESFQAAVPGTTGARAYIAPQPAEYDGTSQMLRTFDDGYVGPSGLPLPLIDGVSQYFGYQRAGQYDEAASTLTFARVNNSENTARRTDTFLTSARSDWNDQSTMDGVGALLTMGYTFATGALFDWSVQAQLGWLDGMEASFQDRTAWSQQVDWNTWESHMARSQSWNYFYDTLGNPAFPSAPYSMSDPTAIGPMISDRPGSIVQAADTTVENDNVVGRRQAVAVSRVSLETKAEAVALDLGPRLRWRPMNRLSVIVQPSLTFNLLDAQLTRTEVVAWESGGVLKSWTDSVDEQKWLFGGSISAGVQWDMTKNLYLHAAGGYDWVNPCDIAIGPDRIHMDISGYRVDLAVGWRIGL